MLFALNSFRKLKVMKHIILFSISVLLTFVSFSQNNINGSDSWNNPTIEGKLKSPELKIYPNPVKGNKVTIDFKSDVISEIQITNIAGKQVLHKKFRFEANKTELQLNDIQNGMYLLKVKSVDNKIVVKKLIVSKE